VSAAAAMITAGCLAGVSGPAASNAAGGNAANRRGLRSAPTATARHGTTPAPAAGAQRACAARHEKRRERAAGSRGASTGPQTTRITGRPASNRRATGARSGLATWYGRPFHGKRTASGRIYNMHRLTAAHRTLPFGTRVRVTNLRNQRQVTVRITDRGPFGKGRIIDLSRAAAQKLRMLRAGVVPVRLEILHWGRNCRTFHGRTTCRPIPPPAQTGRPAGRPRSREAKRRRPAPRSVPRRTPHRRWRRIRSPLLAPAWTPAPAPR
jgi:rare lipoprotein A